MAGKTLALYTGSSSTYELKGIPSPANQIFFTNERITEEARAITLKPLAILPPQEKEIGASQGSSPNNSGLAARSVAPNGNGKAKVGCMDP